MNKIPDTRAQARAAVGFGRPWKIRILRNKMLDATLIRFPSKCSARRSTTSFDRETIAKRSLAVTAKNVKSIPFAINGRRRKSCFSDIRKHSTNIETREAALETLIDIPVGIYDNRGGSKISCIPILEFIGFSGPVRKDIVRKKPLVPLLAPNQKSETLLRDPLSLGGFASDFGKLDYAEKFE